jgi:energy-coupling factor transporter ATP-binding protein EcfA2
MELLDMVGLADVADKLPVALSGGQQQAAAIARALANDPPILVADEPTGNLDSRTAERILTIFEDLALQGKTILIVTHDISLAQRASRRILISDGEVINEHLAKAFPNLPHNLLMEISRLVVERSFPPGSSLTQKGNTDAGFFLVTKGRVDILRRCEKGDQETLGQIGPGEFFSLLDIQEAPSCELCFKAAPQESVEVLSLDRETYQKLVASEGSLAELLQTQAKQRSQEFCPRPKRRFFWRR